MLGAEASVLQAFDLGVAGAGERLERPGRHAGAAMKLAREVALVREACRERGGGDRRAARQRVAPDRDAKLEEIRIRRHPDVPPERTAQVCRSPVERARERA